MFKRLQVWRPPTRGTTKSTPVAPVHLYDTDTSIISSCVIRHFTQVIWGSSLYAGFGRALNTNGTSVYLVAQYSSQGNVLGRYTDNVLPSTTSTTELITSCWTSLEIQFVPPTEIALFHPVVNIVAINSYYYF